MSRESLKISKLHFVMYAIGRSEPSLSSLVFGNMRYGFWHSLLQVQVPVVKYVPDDFNIYT